MNLWNSTLVFVLSGFALSNSTFAGDTRDLARTLVGALPGQVDAVHPSELSKLKIWMAVSFEAIPLLTKIGFKNIFETGQTRGSKDYLKRTLIENGNIGFELPTEPSELRPKYAYLLHEELGPISIGDNYGDLFLEFSPSIYDRTTFSYGDSLDTGAGALSLQRNHVDLKTLQSLYSNELNYGEAQIWGKISFDDVATIIYPNDLTNEKIASLQKLAERHGVNLKSYDPASRKNFRIQSLQEVYNPKLRIPSTPTRPSLLELEKLYLQQTRVIDKCAVLDEIGKAPLPENSKHKLLSKIRSVEKKNLDKRPGQMRILVGREKIVFHRETLAYEDLFVRLERQTHRLARIRNAIIQISRTPKTPRIADSAKKLLANFDLKVAGGPDPSFLIWESKTGRLWSESEKAAMQTAFLTDDWVTIGMIDNSPSVLGDFMKEFDRQIPDWWERERLFAKFLHAASWDVEKFTPGLLEKLKSSTRAKRIKILDALEKRHSQLRAKFSNENAVVRGVKDLINSLRRSFPDDCHPLFFKAGIEVSRRSNLPTV